MVNKDESKNLADNPESLSVLTKCVCTTAAIAGIVVLEVKAIEAGIDGALFAVVIAAIAGLGGYVIKGITQKSK